MQPSPEELHVRRPHGVGVSVRDLTQPLLGDTGDDVDQQLLGDLRRQLLVGGRQLRAVADENVVVESVGLRREPVR